MFGNHASVYAKKFGDFGLRQPHVRIPELVPTNSGDLSPPVGAKRRWFYSISKIVAVVPPSFFGSFFLFVNFVDKWIT